ncbi:MULTISPECIES: ferrous iron transport protein B [Caproicibacterium]|jgi:ferrous iron transport protein B|uniref:Ferrous iron transport protein B n=1 Tax=Caproicibacterium lactatifermentans TaxID=2666138 RepID=A0A859DR78_9FIRM|nr:ferrous iron transport protein B [Caproicibacterium lactatifermentans]ARP50092.1 ferrous iron transport protein B [Ruminococcaceae bacterium CPB6]MDD4807928.1 ferrous iron transport protein B [Oscillospiraceae bacterium]QKN24186.1 ferrous iron transport protein B [Caproicibacterium lactatifermentans]QKO30745.1 ferrous iron transport protein B [Caproicibacterium lactatifermentans]
MIFALAGNQNCGKTTLFNQLTGSNQHVGNFPGVTVERKDGVIRGHKGAVVVDLPGIYSLSPYTSEEIVTRDFIFKNHPDGIINIVDATNIERNLYLTMQLIELDLPMVVCLNMMDEVRNNGGTIHIQELQKELGVPVIPIAASKNEGIDELIEVALETAEEKRRPQRQDFCSGPMHRCIHAVAHLIEDHAQRAGIPPRFAATKLVEGDEPMLKVLKLNQNEIELLGHTVKEMEYDMNTDREAAVADMRYTFIEKLCGNTVIKPKESAEHRRSVRIDEVLTNKYAAIPIFLGIMLLIFWLTFSVIGAALSDLMTMGISALTDLTDTALKAYGINPVVESLVVNGVFSGVGSVLSFLPTIVVLFFFLSLLEDSGYMARVAFVMDSLLRKIGLSGRSFVPMLIGFGCSVPAIMSTRTLSSERDRKMTIFLTPFMSCSAKLPIYTMFTMAFFPKYRSLVMICLYVGGILMGILSALLMKHTVFHGEPVPFVMELPNYRLPTPRNTGLLVWEKAKDFLQRAFTVIFMASIIIWFLQTFDTHLNPVSSSGSSMLADIGRFISPIFAPLGFGDWRTSTALLAGFTAKEAVISTFAVLTGATGAALPHMLSQMFTPLAAVSFLAFTLLYTPCVAAITAVRREMHSRLSALSVVLYQTGIGWLVAFAIYQIGSRVI